MERSECDPPVLQPPVTRPMGVGWPASPAPEAGGALPSLPWEVPLLELPDDPFFVVVLPLLELPLWELVAVPLLEPPPEPLPPLPPELPDASLELVPELLLELPLLVELSPDELPLELPPEELDELAAPPLEEEEPAGGRQLQPPAQATVLLAQSGLLEEL